MACAQAADPPGLLVYGQPGDVDLIQERLLSGTIPQVIAAVDAAKQHRGIWVGCPESAYTWQPASDAQPSAVQVQAHWQTAVQPFLASLDTSYPTAARRWAYAGLGGLAARRSGLAVASAPLQAVAELACSIQYCDATSAWPPLRTPGLYGYVVVPESDPWFDDTPASGTTVGRNLLDLQTSMPSLFAAHEAGPWTGRTFLIADTSLPTFIDGGASYDHGIAGAMMVESAIEQVDPMLRQRWWSSAQLASDWAIAEPLVVNANYTAKLIWLLAECYGVSGDSGDRTALLDKIDRGVLPGVLMDADADGQVDGMPGQSFGALTAIAQVPGRMWDGHNARPAYHAMIAHAMVAAYAALRDRGDDAAAARIRPAVLALLDNLAMEVNALGVPSQGRGLIPLALLTGCWSIGRAEALPCTAWQQAVARCWNAGCFQDPQEAAAASGLYALLQSGKPYERAQERWHAGIPGGSGSGSGTSSGGAGGGGGGCGAGMAAMLCAAMTLGATLILRHGFRR